MSVLIKGMDMPPTCEQCPFCDYEQAYCLVYDIPTSKNRYNKREAWCPLVEVPPHGRLIDADALKKDGWELFKWVGFAIHEMPLNNPSIPTIIEAEVDDG